MKVDITGPHLLLSPAVNEFAMDHATAALRNHVQRVNRVVVRLSDVNGPKGGVDKMCKIEVVLHHAGRVIVEQRAEGAYEAIESATSRVRQAVTRKLDRQQGGRRRAMAAIGGAVDAGQTWIRRAIEPIRRRIRDGRPGFQGRPFPGN